jgi:hypothetical protein
MALAFIQDNGPCLYPRFDQILDARYSFFDTGLKEIGVELLSRIQHPASATNIKIGNLNHLQNFVDFDDISIREVLTWHCHVKPG